MNLLPPFPVPFPRFTRFLRISKAWLNSIMRNDCCLTKSQVDNIKELARKNQISRSALVRMIIREYLNRQSGARETS